MGRRAGGWRARARGALLTWPQDLERGRPRAAEAAPAGDRLARRSATPSTPTPPAPTPVWPRCGRRRGDLEAAREDADRARRARPPRARRHRDATRRDRARAEVARADGASRRACASRDEGARDPAARPAATSPPSWPSWRRAWPRRRPPRAAAPAAGDLTDRELGRAAAARGRGSAREIAAELYVSHNTVKTQVAPIYRKLGVATREDAVARGRELGLLAGSLAGGSGASP